LWSLARRSVERQQPSFANPSTDLGILLYLADYPSIFHTSSVNKYKQ